MNILGTLTLRHLRHNRKRSIITVIGIVLSVAMVTAIAGLVISFQDLLYQDAVQMEGLWHVRYRGLDTATAELVAADPLFSHSAVEQNEEGVTLSLEFVRLHKGIFDESEALCQRYGIGMEQVSYHNNLLIAKGIVPGPYYNALYGFAGILLAVVGVGSVLVISNAFTISADQRGQQFGLLKSAGATKKQIRDMVLFEGLALAGVAIPLGLALGFLAQWTALGIANYFLDNTPSVNLSVRFQVLFSLPALGAVLLVATATVFFSAWLPAHRAARTSAVEAIRQTQAIRLSPRSVRVPVIFARLFGFEGLLAAKTLRRNRGKYRTTILSLVVSIVLFISVSSFGDTLVKATSMVYNDLGSNVLLRLDQAPEDASRQLLDQLNAFPATQLYPSRRARSKTYLPQEWISPTAFDYFESPGSTVHLYSIGEEAFVALCGQLRISPRPFADTALPKAILVNTTDTFIVKGRRTSFTPYRIPKNSQIILEGGFHLELLAQTNQVPAGMRPLFQANALNLVVPQQVLELFPAEDSLYLSAMAEDPDGFEAFAASLLEAWPPESVYLMNYETMIANNRNIAWLVMTFVYGFIAMLSLIGVTSVVTTVSTGVSLRCREFAMLRSVGMTQQGIAKMLSYESLLYGVKALLYGIPLGLVACRLMYAAMSSVMDFEFLWPVKSVFISIVAVFALTFATMHHARRRQRQDSIVASLQRDAV